MLIYEYFQFSLSNYLSTNTQTNLSSAARTMGPFAATMSTFPFTNFKEGGERECSAQGSLLLQQKHGGS